jgi:prevent-host-death family protein
MSTVTLEEAQAQLPQLIEQLHPGEEIIITRNSKPVARLTAELSQRSTTPGQGEDLLSLLARIRAEQQATGQVPRTREEIDADIRQTRDEWEDHQLSVERLQEECRRNRDSAVKESPV